MDQENANPPIMWDKWIRSLILGVGLAAIKLGYLFALEGSIGVSSINKAVAGSATILIGLSLALSGITYFFDALDAQIVYRKYVGVMGALFAFGHVLITLINIGRLDHIIRFLNSGKSYTLFGISAALLLVMLTLISNTFSARTLGNVLWRRLLRLGYVALAFTALHFGLMKYKIWLAWFKDPSTLPPTSLLLIAPVIVVFLMRLLLAVALAIRHEK